MPTTTVIIPLDLSRAPANQDSLETEFRAVVGSDILCFQLFIIILPLRINYKENKKDNKFKISIQLGRSDYGGEISEKPTSL